MNIIESYQNLDQWSAEEESFIKWYKEKIVEIVRKDLRSVHKIMDDRSLVVILST